jgi:hypothetical protein
VRQGGTTFTLVPDGAAGAIQQARAAARGKDVQVSRGAATIPTCLDDGLLGELEIHLAQVLLGRRAPVRTARCARQAAA